MLSGMGPSIAVLSAFLSRHQSLIALLCCVALALPMLGIPMHPALVIALAVTAGALGVARPSETAAKIAGEVASARGGVSIGALVAALAGSLTLFDTTSATVEHPVIDVTEVGTSTGDASTESGSESTGG